MPSVVEELVDSLLSAAGNFVGFDAWNEGDKLILRFEAAGFEKGDFLVTVENQCLVVRASRTKLDRKYLVRSSKDSFTRVIPLPDNCDHEKVEASYENGVLTVSVDKAEDKKAKKVQVK